MQRKLVILFLLLALLILSLPLQAQDTPPDPSTTNVTVSTTTAAVRVRSGPGTNFTVRGTLYVGFVLVATGRSDYDVSFTCTGNPANDQQAWLRVELSQGAEGWVNLCVVVVAGDDTTLPVSDPAYPETIDDEDDIPPIEGDDSPVENPDLVSITLAVVIVRSAPNLGGAALGTIDDGEFVEMLAITYGGSWVQIRYKGVTGWIINFAVLITNDQEDILPVYVSISGTIESIVGNTIYIFGVPITLSDISGLAPGMTINLEGTSPPGDSINITTIVIIVIVSNSGELDDDGGNTCKNGPPPWAPAHGWRRKCEIGNSA